MILDIHDQITSLFNHSDSSIANENANKDTRTISTQRDILAGMVSKAYGLKMIPPHVAQAHKDGSLHYHDLDYSPLFSSYNCMLVALRGMLRDGYNMGNASIESPRSFTTACNQTTQIIAQVASHIYGGTSIHEIDDILADYAELSYQRHLEDDNILCAVKSTLKEIYDGVQSLEYEVNTLHTSNGQTPFVTFGFGNSDKPWAKEIQQAMLRVRIRGLGERGRTPVFPKLVYTIRKGHNSKPNDPYYDVKRLALECASKRMYPDILSYEKCIEVTGGYKTPMGCRSFLDGEETHGRNNLGVVSLNLPRIALEASVYPEATRMEVFHSKLEFMMQTAIDGLHYRISRYEGVTTDCAPILYTEGACGVKLKAGEEISGLFKNGRATISMGYIGMHETAEIMFPDQEHILTNTTKQEFVKDILRSMKTRTQAEKTATGYHFSVYGTPSENLCDRFAGLDKTYGHPTSDKGYYTNSFHLDVAESTSLLDKIDFEAQFVGLSTGGFICYGEFPDMKDNLDGLEAVWDYAMDAVPYYGTNTPCDECYKCGSMKEFNATVDGYSCSECGNNDSGTVSVIRRVCGYLGSPDARPFIHGKQTEVTLRTKHT